MTVIIGSVLRAFGLLIPLDGAEILEHLLIDRLIKIGIVLVALVAIVIGMVIIWRRSGRRSR